MYLAELLILADKYEDKGFDTYSFRLKIKRLTQHNFYINTNTKDNYHIRLTGYSNSNGVGNYSNGTGDGFGNWFAYYRFGNDYGCGIGNGYGCGIGNLYNGGGHGHGEGDFNVFG